MAEQHATELRALGVADEHHAKVNQFHLTPGQLKEVAAKMGISISDLIQLLITQGPQIIALVQSIIAMFNKPKPAPTTA